jgi:phosphoribosyl 1,2-cyclic phosphodiesterase
MALRFTVLASGSSGNATVVEANGFGVLIDAGLGPRLLTHRLAAVGLSWQHIQAMLLTHTHSDHWKEPSLLHLFRRRIPLYCHVEHQPLLRQSSAAFRALQNAKLIREYTTPQPWHLAPHLKCRAFALSHDSGATFGFRFETDAAAAAYVADLGTWSEDLVEQLLDVDLLALEFNHDVDLEKNSGRSHYLIARVLGDEGHLSNDQAAGLLRRVLDGSQSGRMQHIVQLHLSRDCNRAGLAVAAAQNVMNGDADMPAIHTARHDVPGPSLLVSARPQAAGHNGKLHTQPSSPSRSMEVTQQFFPGWEAG